MTTKTTLTKYITKCTRIDGRKTNLVSAMAIAVQGPAGEGVPTGGTTGQVLAKTGNGDFATGWVDQSGGSTPHVFEFDPSGTSGPATFVADQASTVVTGISIGTTGVLADLPTVNAFGFNAAYASATANISGGGSFTASLLQDYSEEFVLFHNGTMTTADMLAAVAVGTLPASCAVAIVSVFTSSAQSLMLLSSGPSAGTASSQTQYNFTADGTTLSFAGLTAPLNTTAYPLATIVTTQPLNTGGVTALVETVTFTNDLVGIPPAPLPSGIKDGDYLKIIDNNGTVLGTPVEVRNWCQVLENLSLCHVYDQLPAGIIISISAISSGLSAVSSGLSNTNSSVSAVSSGLSDTSSAVSSVSSGLSDANSVVSSISSGLSNTNSSVSSISSGLSDTQSTVSLVSTGLSNEISRAELAESTLSTGYVAGDASTLAAAQAFASSLVTQAVELCGEWDATAGLFPTAGGTGPSGAIAFGDLFIISNSTPQQLGPYTVGAGDFILALENTPGQTAANWNYTQGKFGYTPAPQSALNATNTSVSALSAGLSNATSAVSAVSSGLGQTNTAVSNVSSGLSNTNYSVSVLSSGLSIASSSVSTVSASLSNTSSAVSSVSSGLSVTTSATSAISSGLSSVSTGLSITQSSVSSVSSGLSATTTIVSSVSSGLSTTTSSLSAVSSGLSALTSSLSAISSGISGSFSNTNSSVSAISSGLSSTTVVLTSTQVSLSSVSSGLSSVSSGLSIAQSSVSAISSSLGTMAAQNASAVAITGGSVDTSSGMSAFQILNSGAATQSGFVLKNVSGGTDQKNWYFYSAPSLTFGIETITDAYAGGQRFFAVTRGTGTAVGQIQLVETGVGNVVIGTTTNSGSDKVYVSGSIGATGAILNKGATGIGYGVGSGGTVTQATSKTTGVTLNKTSGQITMNAAALAAGAIVNFTLTNSTIASADVVAVSIASGATAATYDVGIDSTSAGSCVIRVWNYNVTGRSEAIVLNFVVIKGSTS